MQRLFLLMGICWVINLKAQELNISFSPSSKVENDVSNFHRYGNNLYSDKTNWGKMQLVFFANLKNVNYGVELTQYDEQLKVIKKLSLDNEKKDFGPFQPLVHYGKLAIYVMYFKFTNEGKIKMFASIVDPKDLTVVSTKEIMEYDQKNQGFLGAYKTISDAQIFYTISEDGKNAWIVHASPKLIQSCVVDGELNIVEKAEIIPVKLEKFLITDASFGKDGSKVLAYRYENPKHFEFYNRGLYIQPSNKEGSFVSMKLPNNYFPGSLTLKQSNNSKKLYIGGEYYGEDYTYGGKGVLIGEVNVATQSISTPTFYPYTQELKQSVYDLDFASKRKGEIIFSDKHLNYTINEMDNGTLVLSADMYFFHSGIKYSSTFRGPIIHAFIKPDGNSSMTLIPKKHGATSYTSNLNYVYKDKLICIHGDLAKYQQKDFEYKDLAFVRSTSDMIPIANIYNSDGKLLKKIMLIDDEKKIKGSVMIGNYSIIGENKLLFPIGETKVNMVKYYFKVNQILYLDIQ